VPWVAFTELVHLLAVFAQHLALLVLTEPFEAAVAGMGLCAVLPSGEGCTAVFVLDLSCPSKELNQLGKHISIVVGEEHQQGREKSYNSCK
jgi:hypothetical protein